MGLIYVDACLLIYAFEAHPTYGAAVRARLARAEGQLAISPLVHLECLVGPMKTGNQVQRRHVTHAGRMGVAHGKFVEFSIQRRTCALSKWTAA